MIFDPTCSLIVATDNRGVIAKAGKIPWHSPKDFKWFKANTVGKLCIVGHKTYLDLPNHHLSDRPLLVFRKGTVLESREDWLQEAKYLISSPRTLPVTNETMVIGGSQTYRFFMPLVSRIYLTTIDTFVPSTSPEEPSLTLFQFPNWNEWKMIYQSLEHDEKASIHHDSKVKGLNMKFNLFQRNP